MTVMLSSFAPLRVNSAKQLSAERDRPFAAAQGDKQGPSIGNNLRKSPAPSVGATIKVAPTDHPASCLSSWLRLMPIVP